MTDTPAAPTTPRQSFCCNPQMYGADHAEGCEAHPQRKALQSDTPAPQSGMARLSRNEEAER